MKSILLISVVLLFSGCSFLQNASRQVASGVVKYCEQSFDVRSLARESINVELASYGHIVHVHCKGDPDGPAQ